MSDLTFNKYAGAVLATAFVIAGLVQLSGGVFSQEKVAKPGFAVAVQEETGGGPAHVVAPPRDVIATLNAHMVKALNAPDTQKRLAEHGAEAAPTTPAEFGALLKSDTARWAQVIKDAGVPSE